MTSRSGRAANTVGHEAQRSGASLRQADFAQTRCRPGYDMCSRVPRSATATITMTECSSVELTTVCVACGTQLENLNFRK